MASVKKTNALRLLEQAGIEYEAFEYDGEGGRISGEVIAERIGQPVDRVCKTLVTTTDRREHFVFVVPVKGSLDLKLAAKAAGVKSLAMLPLGKLFPLTGYLHGGCSPVGLKTPMKVFIDESVRDVDFLFVSGGRIGLNVKVRPHDLARLVGAVFAPLAQSML